MKLFRISFICILLAVATSCAISGDSKSGNELLKFVTGASKVNATKDVHIINIFRAIGSPNSSTNIDRYKYYKWEYSRAIGVSTLFGGGSTTLYCHFTAETQNNKVKMLNWYGNQCDIYLDQINDYFQNKLNIVVITEEEIKSQSPVKSEANLMNKEKEKEVAVPAKPQAETAAQPAPSNVEQTQPQPQPVSSIHNAPVSVPAVVKVDELAELEKKPELENTEPKKEYQLLKASNEL